MPYGERRDAGATPGPGGTSPHSGDRRWRALWTTWLRAAPESPRRARTVAVMVMTSSGRGDDFLCYSTRAMPGPLGGLATSSASPSAGLSMYAHHENGQASAAGVPCVQEHGAAAWSLAAGDRPEIRPGATRRNLLPTKTASSMREASDLAQVREALGSPPLGSWKRVSSGQRVDINARALAGGLATWRSRSRGAL